MTISIHATTVLPLSTLCFDDALM